MAHAPHRCRRRPAEGRRRARAARALSRPLRGAGQAAGLAPVAWHELGESRAATAAKRSAEEGAALLKLARDADAIIALDERGKALSSDAFAQLLAKIRDDGAKAAGHPDRRARRAGARRARQPPSCKLSFGAMTLPHGLARIVLAEQLYRAATILPATPTIAHR